MKNCPLSWVYQLSFSFPHGFHVYMHTSQLPSMLSLESRNKKIEKGQLSTSPEEVVKTHGYINRSLYVLTAELVNCINEERWKEILLPCPYLILLCLTLVLWARTLLLGWQQDALEPECPELKCLSSWNFQDRYSRMPWHRLLLLREWKVIPDCNTVEFL